MPIPHFVTFLVCNIPVPVSQLSIAAFQNVWHYSQMGKFYHSLFTHTQDKTFSKSDYRTWTVNKRKWQHMFRVHRKGGKLKRVNKLGTSCNDQGPWETFDRFQLLWSLGIPRKCKLQVMHCYSNTMYVNTNHVCHVLHACLQYLIMTQQQHHNKVNYNLPPKYQSLVQFSIVYDYTDNTKLVFLI